MNLKKMYSQNNEEQIISDYFGDHVGTFLDLGANDGKTLSNTYGLLLKGWTGDYVEPSRIVSSLLYDNVGSIIKNREGYEYPVAHEYAVGTETKKITFHESVGTHSRSLVSTIVPTEKDRWGDSEQWQEYEVDCYTFADLYERLHYKTYDFINIDIEGMDYEVLTQMDLKELGCKCLCVEFNGKEPQKYIDYCAKFGLKEIARNGENLIFAL